MDNYNWEKPLPNDFIDFNESDLNHRHFIPRNNGMNQDYGSNDHILQNSPKKKRSHKTQRQHNHQSFDNRQIPSETTIFREPRSCDCRRHFKTEPCHVRRNSSGDMHSPYAFPHNLRGKAKPPYCLPHMNKYETDHWSNRSSFHRSCTSFHMNQPEFYGNHFYMQDAPSRKPDFPVMQNYARPCLPAATWESGSFQMSSAQSFIQNATFNKPQICNPTQQANTDCDIFFCDTETKAEVPSFGTDSQKYYASAESATSTTPWSVQNNDSVNSTFPIVEFSSTTDEALNNPSNEKKLTLSAADKDVSMELDYLLSSMDETASSVYHLENLYPSLATENSIIDFNSNSQLVSLIQIGENLFQEVSEDRESNVIVSEVHSENQCHETTSAYGTMLKERSETIDEEIKIISSSKEIDSKISSSEIKDMHLSTPEVVHIEQEASSAILPSTLGNPVRNFEEKRNCNENMSVSLEMTLNPPIFCNDSIGKRSENSVPSYNDSQFYARKAVSNLVESEVDSTDNSGRNTDSIPHVSIDMKEQNHTSSSGGFNRHEAFDDTTTHTLENKLCTSVNNSTMKSSCNVQDENLLQKIFRSSDLKCIENLFLSEEGNCIDILSEMNDNFTLNLPSQNLKLYWEKPITECSNVLDSEVPSNHVEISVIQTDNPIIEESAERTKVQCGELGTFTAPVYQVDSDVESNGFKIQHASNKIKCKEKRMSKGSTSASDVNYSGASGTEKLLNPMENCFTSTGFDEYTGFKNHDDMLELKRFELSKERVGRDSDCLSRQKVVKRRKRSTKNGNYSVESTSVLKSSESSFTYSSILDSNISLNEIETSLSSITNYMLEEPTHFKLFDVDLDKLKCPIETDLCCKKSTYSKRTRVPRQKKVSKCGLQSTLADPFLTSASKMNFDFDLLDEVIGLSSSEHPSDDNDKKRNTFQGSPSKKFKRKELRVPRQKKARKCHLQSTSADLFLSSASKSNLGFELLEDVIESSSTEHPSDEDVQKRNTSQCSPGKKYFPNKSQLPRQKKVRKCHLKSTLADPLLSSARLSNLGFYLSEDDVIKLSSPEHPSDDDVLKRSTGQGSPDRKFSRKESEVSIIEKHAKPISNQNPSDFCLDELRTRDGFIKMDTLRQVLKEFYLPKVEFKDASTQISQPDPGPSMKDRCDAQTQWTLSDVRHSDFPVKSEPVDEDDMNPIIPNCSEKRQLEGDSTSQRKRRGKQEIRRNFSTRQCSQNNQLDTDCPAICDTGVEEYLMLKPIKNLIVQLHPLECENILRNKQVSSNDKESKVSEKTEEKFSGSASSPKGSVKTRGRRCKLRRQNQQQCQSEVKIEATISEIEFLDSDSNVRNVRDIKIKDEISESNTTTRYFLRKRNV